ncbi:hypothetical protein Droror1_Dr00019776 [Drosera rotundifolia]
MSSIDYKSIHGVKFFPSPSKSILEKVFTKWNKYSSPPASIPWTFASGNETMYIVKGRVRVRVLSEEGKEGEGEGEEFDIEKGDLVEFPMGMRIEFVVVEELEKYFKVQKE